ncbi:unnamed protein product [Caenorhabditis nigoni]
MLENLWTIMGSDLRGLYKLEKSTESQWYNEVPGHLGCIFIKYQLEIITKEAGLLGGNQSSTITEFDRKSRNPETMIGGRITMHALLIAISFFGRLIDVIEVKKVLEGPKGRHCLGFMARWNLPLNVPLLPNDRNQILKEHEIAMTSVRIAFRYPKNCIHSDFKAHFSNL